MVSLSTSAASHVTQVTLECLSYHATAPLEDALMLARRKIPSGAALKLHSFSFDDFSLSDEDTLQVRSTT